MTEESSLSPGPEQASVDRTSPFPEPQAWLESGEYLPDFMRDFHDQKDLFKALQDVVERSNQRHGNHRMLNASWAENHIYTVDVFLWCMARRGYTLQRSRQRLNFEDIHDFISASKAIRDEQSIAVLRQAFAGSSAPTDASPTSGRAPK